MEIIGILGFKGSGKDTAAEYLINHHNYTKFAFADSVKDVLATMFCWDRTALEGTTPESRQWRETVDVWWANKLQIPNFTPRYAMTTIGTDVMRRYFNDAIWIHNTEKRVLDSGAENVVITDCRYPNEAASIRRMGGKLIRVSRGPEPEYYQYSSIPSTDPGYAEAQNVLSTTYGHIHSSEWAWNNIPVDAILDNNGSREDLKQNFQTLLLKWRQNG